MNYSTTEREQTGGPETPAGNAPILDVYLDAADVMYARVSEALGSVGLSYAKYEVLRYLQDAGDPLSLSALADCQRCARSNITQLIDRLEGEGFVRRVDDPADRRSVRAELTSAGATLVDRGRAQLEAVRSEFAALFNETERAELARLVARIQ